MLLLGAREGRRILTLNSSPRSPRVLRFITPIDSVIVFHCNFFGPLPQREGKAMGDKVEDEGDVGDRESVTELLQLPDSISSSPSPSSHDI
ncbi:hypothetical protein SAY86_005055 [Trapa natans]|uniref:Uncharacterized protein n=1 Tax=Trapa natans TaxID=22666 RepID=A0AAN7KZB9_TRANT|nr:hypothetical protein SAY86_005055 [Trapa natans]